MKHALKNNTKLRKLGTYFIAVAVGIGFVLLLNQYFEIFDKIDFGKAIYIPNLLSIIFTVTIIATIFIVILEKGHPSKTIAWILILILFPLVGILLYLYFGKNYRKDKIFSRKGVEDIPRILALSKNQITELDNHHLIKKEYIKGKKGIIRLLLNNSKALLTENNRIEIFNNGKEKFEALLASLHNAKHHIHLQYYIIDDDHIGNLVKELLINKANEGVAVKVLYDEVGSWGLSKKFIRELRKGGVKISGFMPVRFPLFANKVNYRNHRKIVVVDGRVGFLGGFNIADRYIEGTTALGPWRDTHLKIEGDAVHSLQAIFVADWYFANSEYLKDEAYFPKHQIMDKTLVQITACGPDSDWASIMQAYFMAITTAKKYIYISTPYFVPNESIMTALKIASLSGIRVIVLLPEKADFFLYTWTTRSYVEELLEAGITVFSYQKGFTHSKVMIVDGIFSSVGSANMDVRSFEQNFEVNALIYDKTTTDLLQTAFQNDLKNSEEIIFDEFKKRPSAHKFAESVAKIFTPLL